MFKRKNPMPMSGALFLSNPRKGGGKKTASTKSSSTKTRKAKRPSVAARIIARLNRSTPMKMNRRRKRKNGLALRTNGLALRMNRRRKSSRRRTRKNGLALRMNGLALRMNRRRRARRTNGRKHAMVVRMNRKHSVVLKNRRRRRNTGIATQAKSGAMGLVAPLAFGAAAGALHLYALRFLGGYLPDMLKPVGYTLGGIAVKALLSLKFIPGSAAVKSQLGNAAVVVGAAFDVTRALKGESSQFGDGGFYVLGGHTRPFDSVGRVISAQYSDAKAADALHTTEDLTPSEVDAAIRGGAAWVDRFPFISRQQNATGGCSRHAAQAGHRWAWLCNAIGFENFRKLAASSAERRVAYIRKVREEAIAALRSQRITPSVVVPMGIQPSVVLPEGIRPAVQLPEGIRPAAVFQPKSPPAVTLGNYASDYGATLFAGGPF